MDRRAGLVLLAGSLFAILLVSVTTAGGVKMWHAPPPERSSNTFVVGTVPAESIPVETTPPPTEEEKEVPSVIRWLVLLLLAVIAVLALIGAVYMWRNRPRVRWRRDRLPDQPFDVLPDIAAAISTDAEAQRASLMRGSVRNAIVECWLRLEHAVAAAGLERAPADTSAEFTERVLRAYAVDHDAIVGLAALYREARFSTHEMGEDDRSATLAFLERVHDSLSPLALEEPLPTA